MLNNKTKYAIKALILLAITETSEPVQIHYLAEKGNIPKKFLEQILLMLKKLGYIDSKRGKEGGYFLAISPQKISIGEVIRNLNGPLALLSCASISQYKKCDCIDEEKCAIRKLFREVRDKTSEILDDTSLADLIHTSN